MQDHLAALPPTDADLPEGGLGYRGMLVRLPAGGSMQVWQGVIRVEQEGRVQLLAVAVRGGNWNAGCFRPAAGGPSRQFWRRADVIDPVSKNGRLPSGFPVIEYPR